MTNDDEREALADRLLAFAQSASMSDLKNGRTDVLLAAIAVLRRSEVPEPSVLAICECYRDGSEMVTCERHTAAQAEPLRDHLGWDMSLQTKQGEPSDAQVEAAAQAMFEPDGPGGEYTWAEMVVEDVSRADLWREDARKVLRAAGWS